MIGPVLRQEMLLGSRRHKMHVFRWAFAAYLIVLVTFFYLKFQVVEASRSRAGRMGMGVIAYNHLSSPLVVGDWFSEWFLGRAPFPWVLFSPPVFLLIATPPFVAGAIADEKRSGTLQYLLTSDLDARHIIVGKMFGRVAQVFLLALAGLPLFGLMSGFGGVRVTTVALAFVSLLPSLFGVSAASVLASVLCRQTRDAVLGLYVVAVVVWVALYLCGWHMIFAPDYVIGPLWGQRGVVGLADAGWRLLTVTGCWLGLATVCLTVAVVRLRPVYRRELEGFRSQGVRWFSVERDPVPDDAVRWRERHVEGLAPTPALRRIPQWLGITGVALVTTVSSLLILYASMPAGSSVADLLRASLRLDVVKLQTLMPGAATGFLVQSFVALLLATLIVGVRCSGSITGERERHTWEALLLTPIPAPQIVRSKLWGVIGASYWYLLAYAAPATALSIFGGVLAFFWTILWLSVTVLAMYFIGAAGIWCSVRSRDSWRALVGTLLWGYVGAGVIFTVTSPVVAILALILVVLLKAVDVMLNTQMAAGAMAGFGAFMSKPFLITGCVALAGLFLLLARLMLNWAQRWIADRERTRHWNDEPTYRRSRRGVPQLRRY